MEMDNSIQNDDKKALDVSAIKTIIVKSERPPRIRRSTPKALEAALTTPKKKRARKSIDIKSPKEKSPNNKEITDVKNAEEIAGMYFGHSFIKFALALLLLKSLFGKYTFTF